MTDVSDVAAQIAQKMMENTSRDESVEILLPYEAREDTPDGFFAFCQLFLGKELHSEAKRWVKKAYEAHEQGRGSAHECHRESGKTTVFSKFFLAFRIGHEPEKTNAIIRINDDKARETAEGVSAIIENDPRWKKVFPHVVPDHERGWGAKGYFVKRDDIPYEEWQEIRTQSPDDPTFVGYGWKSGSIIGSRFNGVVIIDDIHNRENTRSDLQLREVKHFYKETLEYCRMEGAWEIWNFTPWTTNDVYAYIKSTGEYVHSKTPVIYPASEDDPDAEYWEPMPLNRDHPDAGDIPLSGKYWKRYWKEAWSWKRLARKYRKTGAVGFARQMLLDLDATRGRVLKKEWLHYYPIDEIPDTALVFIGVDYASTEWDSKGADPDYFSLALGKALPQGGLVVIDGFRGHLTKGEAIQKVGSWAGAYPHLSLVGVESIGEGRGFYSDLLLAQDMTGKNIPLHKIGSHGKRSKGERFENWLAPRFQGARIFLGDVENEFLRRFEEEWLTYPEMDHDDVLDAVYMLAAAAEGHLGGYGARMSTSQKSSPSPFSSFGRRRRKQLYG